jgi:hypothetical protein
MVCNSLSDGRKLRGCRERGPPSKRSLGRLTGTRARSNSALAKIGCRCSAGRMTDATAGVHRGACWRGGMAPQEAMTTGEKAWGVKLSGHIFDLEDWRDTLREPFDPWVLHDGDEFFLRTSEFQSCNLAEEVLERAKTLFDVLNGAMRAAKRAHPVTYAGIYEFLPDGQRRKPKFPPNPLTNLRVKVHGATPILPPLSSPNKVQVWAKLSDSSDHLGDALVYVGRGGWFDIYKAIECLEDWAGGQNDLERRQWVDTSELRLMKRTANSHRHRAGGVTPPPQNPVSQERALEMLARLIECSFAEVEARATMRPGSPGGGRTEV